MSTSMDEKREPAYDYMVAKLRDITGLTDCHISGLWKINLMYQPKIGERIFEYEVIVCQTTLGQGASYSFEAVDVKLFSQLLGKSVSEIDFNSYDNFPLKVAILDSIFSCFYPGTPALETGLSGRSSAKATSRAEIVCSEVLKILIDRIQGNRLKGKIPTVLNIGYVSRFRTVLKNLINHRFLSTDLHPDLIGKMVDDVYVEDGNDKNEEYLKVADVAIVTGMTITTKTLTEIINSARRYDTSLVVFAETAYNLASHYINLGVDSVVCEEFPYYIFDGTSIIRVFRK
ncbi:MAG: DUF364 domain-containing protein [Candidatus Thermoplasmatota archaeon]|nr:DUF364 domain-containing protein [Candidatus Thermoplasmatota archaeon]